MKSLQIAGLSLALGIVVSSTIEGQTSRGVFRLPAQSSGRQATQPTRKAERVRVDGPWYLHAPAYPHAPASPRYPVAYTMLPAVVMSDGGIYADFGSGYEPVRRACSQPRILGSNSVLRSNVRPTYTQPVPAQSTASQLMARGQSTPGQRVVNACYRMDAYGPAVIFAR